MTYDVMDRVFSLIRENQDLFEFTQVNAMDGFLIFQPSSPDRIWLNPKLRSVLGYSSKDFEKEEFTSDFLDKETTALINNIEKGKTRLFLKHKQGFKLRLSVNVQKIQDQDFQYLILGFNQTNQSPELKYNLLRKINRYEKIIEGAELGNWQWNIQTGETIFSDKWAEVLGYNIDELRPTSIKTWESLSHPQDQEKCNRELQKHFEGKTDYYLTDARMRNKQGNWVWVRDKGKVVSWTKNGEPEWMTGFHTDITEEKNRLEIKRLFIDQAPSAIAMFDREMEYIAASNKWLEDYHITDRQVIGKCHYDIFPNISDEWKEVHQKCMLGEIHSKDEDCYFYPDGTEQWISWEIRPWYTSDHKIGGILMHTADITPMKLAEREMFKRQQLIETVLESIDVGIVACDQNGSLSLFNRATKDWHGLPLKPIPQNELSEYYGLFNIEGTKALDHSEIPLLKVLNHGKLENDEIMIKPKIGKARKVSVNGSQLFDENGKIAGAVIAMHDITKRIEAENKHKISQESFRGSFEHAAIGMAIVNPDGKWVQINNRVCDIVGYSATELKELNFRDITHPEDLDLDLKLLNELIEGKREFYHMDKRYYHKDGHLVYINLAVSLVRNDKNKPLFFVSQITDISNEKIAEAKLRKTLAELEGLLDSSTRVSMISINPEGTITAFNKGAENLLGYSREEMIGKRTTEVVHSKKELKARSLEFEENYGERFEGVELLKAMALKGGFDTREWLYKPKNGAMFPVQLTLTAIKDQNEIIGYLAVATNISKLKNAERELSNILELTKDQNDRLKNFAHIVSHNLRSHSGNFGMLLDLFVEEYPDQKRNQIIEMLYKSSDGLKETIEHLNEVTVINTSVSETLVKINLRKEVDRASSSVAGLINNAHLEIINKVPADCNILGVKAYMESILLNFTTNAIKYRSTDRDSFISFSIQKRKQHIQLIIEDNGLGIDLKKHRQKLFGMYKTFHKHKDSRGIGLFITKNQIEAMEGSIEVESAVDQGTKFIINLKKG
ncbi:PAS domain S-box protein [Gramella sp. MAR_2010_147]|uniref:PAS domain S-box protein n=1 Tax=Gramella sp. MAR_2010_147 TaxID=1250205 RepID=UPI00087B9319|nr:PAS domain S-box protein [Gramella sp. MAR_2010_147]SDR73397.1 PAS domain S-box-containing protein [Gramella sp. MAR_2010_147]